MTYLDILEILFAWLLLGSLYALTITVSAVRPHFSTWTLHSGKTHIKAMLRIPENTNPRPRPLLFKSKIVKLFCYV